MNIKSCLISLILLFIFLSPIPSSLVLAQSPNSCNTKAIGDANCDGIVDGIDYLQWEDEFSSSQDLQNNGVKTNNYQADFNSDGIVDMIDYEIWRRNTGSFTSPSVTQIPTIQPIITEEPGTTTIALGIYEPPVDKSGNPNYSDPSYYGNGIDNYTTLIGKKPAYAWASVKWKNANTGNYNEFNDKVGPALDQYRNRGILPGINWDPTRGEARAPQNKQYWPDFSWQKISDGTHDAYITRFANETAAYGHPFLLRLMEEMNGNWYPWGYNTNGNTNPAHFVTAWVHIVDIFRKAGATNVQFVWCQSALEASQINSHRDILKQLYPLDNYVDYIALDGYANPKNNYRLYKDEFGPSYDLLTSPSFSTRPMIFYENGATEKTNPPDPNVTPSDLMFKANWITQGFLNDIPQLFPKVIAVSWFDGHTDTTPLGYSAPFNYVVNTSQNSLNAWKQVVSSPLYQGNLLK